MPFLLHTAPEYTSPLLLAEVCRRQHTRYGEYSHQTGLDCGAAVDGRAGGAGAGRLDTGLVPESQGAHASANMHSTLANDHPTLCATLLASGLHK